jgi:BioD-like phosphotransacetylase family protein
MVCLYLSTEVGLSGLHTICIGLALHLKEEGLEVGYIKPLGYRYHEVGGKVADEDAIFMRQALGLEDDLQDLSPVVLTPHLVREGLMGEAGDLLGKVKESFKRISSGKDVILAQGAFSSKQGQFLGLSAYQVAPALDARVIMVERFDDAFLADNILEARHHYGESLIGVIFNIVPDNRTNFLEEILAPYLEKEGIPVLGMVPDDRMLRSINVGDLARLIEGRVLCGEEYLDNMVEDILVGAMSAEHALNIFRKRHNICVVTGGDRSAIQLAAIEANARCLILSGNLYPSSIILGKAEEMGIPIILVSTDTFTTAERAEMIIRSARTHEEIKLKKLEELLSCCLDYQRLYDLAGIKV